MPTNGRLIVSQSAEGIREGPRLVGVVSVTTNRHRPHHRLRRPMRAVIASAR